MNHRGNRTPPRLATAIVITTGSAMRPRKALGNPNSKWIYTDKREVAVSKGIRKVTIKDLARIGQPGVWAIFLNGKGGTIPLHTTSQSPLRLTVELNDTALPPGGTPGRDQCGEAVFSAEECRVLVTNLRCQK